MNIGLEIRPNINSSREELNAILDYLHQKKQDILLLEGVEFPDKPDFIYTVPEDDFIDNIELLLSIGGDGTFLGGMRRVKGTDVPIMGVHLGGLGFLAELTIDNYKNKFELFFNNDYSIEERYGFQAELEEKNGTDCLWAINEFHIDKGHKTSMIPIKTYVGDEYLNTYRADGLLVSTPTGSTAYGLSAGGPIITPDLDIVSIQPICPHNLSIRPVIVSGEKKIRIDCRDFNDDQSLVVDGQRRFNLHNTDRINIKKSSQIVNLIRFESESFFKTLRSKLHWGIDVRGEEEK